MEERLSRWLLFPPLLALLLLLLLLPRGLVLRFSRSPGRKFSFQVSELCRHVPFDMRGRDVMVFLHIQKTGGTTFGRHLVRNIRLEQPCYCRAGQKKCACHRPGGGGDKGDTWLFSRFSTGWSCGLHADWTELTNCVPAAMDRRRGCPANRTL
ncbi:heparan-sulfate 6-O-sulfotransferase 3-like, partial [Python bivittatus]|uniref:Heparan-sulfate 6-O-sulfotransferase n=1 Tax=Python bivittatus TaxID=176946 RepID=A0A9F2WFT6_PYTBI